MTWESQPRISPEAQGLKRLGSAINHVFGDTVTLLTPSGGDSLFMRVEVGNFRVQLGDVVATLTFAAPTGDVTDGSGSLLLKVGDTLEITRPDNLTVIGGAASDILTHWTH